MVFDGKLEGETITGGFQNDGMAGTFTLQRARAEPFPYRVEEVRFRNGNVMLVGTLCVPATAGRHPAIIFNHGSGRKAGGEPTVSGPISSPTRALRRSVMTSEAAAHLRVTGSRPISTIWRTTAWLHSVC